ncbi:hypothetical protein, partial [Bacillus cereus]
QGDQANKEILPADTAKEASDFVKKVKEKKMEEKEKVKKPEKNACCVEQTQPGMIDGDKVQGFNLLPLSIRKEHFKQYIYGQKV